MATAQLRASTALANSARTLSPGESTTLPCPLSMAEAIISRLARMAFTVAASSCPISRLYPFTSALNMAASLRCTGSDFTFDLNIGYVNFLKLQDVREIRLPTAAGPQQ